MQMLGMSVCDALAWPAGFAGELSGVWVPDAVHEAVRDLVRGRTTAAEDVRRKRQLIEAWASHKSFKRKHPDKNHYGSNFHG